jgi:tRNA G18 (ribose-2'-O)-methylase SpoU
MSCEPIHRRQLRSAAEIDEALDCGRPIRFVLCLETRCGDAVERVVARAESMGVTIRRVGEREMRRLVPIGIETQVLGLEGPAPATSLAEVMQGPGIVWLLVGCVYPSNAGYVIRSAEVSGAAGVVIASRFDRVERRDCLRYGMRVDRFFPVHFGAAEQTVALARNCGRTVVAVEDVGKLAPWQADLRGPLLAIVGGEEGGIPDALLAAADQVVRVPMHGFLPSYNLQAAMAVVMGERLRQTESSCDRVAPGFGVVQ